MERNLKGEDIQELIKWDLEVMEKKYEDRFKTVEQ